MHGRRRELNIGLDLLGSRRSRGGILLVEGEPGIGKSRILRGRSDAAARHRFSLVCDAADKPLDQLRDGLSGPHAASWSAQPLLALSAGVGPGAGGRDGGDAGVSPGPAAAPGTPGRLLIVVDDVHCADPETLKAFFSTVQSLHRERKLLAYHDRSDGGLFAALLEMALASRCALTIALDELPGTPLAALFNEELGAVLQVRCADRHDVVAAFEAGGLRCVAVGAPRSTRAALSWCP
jgi:hypothetical protein